jgi:pyruvate,orthophosphate dikinase
MTTKWVYRYDEVDAAEATAGDWEGVRALLGGKGANLGEMTRLGVPVPPGFVVTTEACNSYDETGGLSDDVWEQIVEAMADLERRTGKGFGDPDRPLLVACRSGAKFSMPGMMDTVLDIGLNDEVVKAWCEREGQERFALDSYRRLVQMFGSVVLGVDDEYFEHVMSGARERRGVGNDAELTSGDLRDVIAEMRSIVERRGTGPLPSEPMEQLRLAVEAVFASWGGKRAHDYRVAAGIAHDLGTAVNIVTMVFGNSGPDSATGVAMSRNATTGEHHIEGDYLVNAQGEDVVAGIRPTVPIDELAKEMPEVYAQFAGIADRLERHFREMQDMEFTIEEGHLWLLQTRNGKRTAQAAVRIAVEMANDGLITKDEALLRVEPAQVDFFLHPQFTAESKTANTVIATGLNVSPGAATGEIAFDADTAEAWAKDGQQVLLVRQETRPDDVHGMLASVGILTSKGGRTSHAALVARQFGKPAVVGAAALEVDTAGRVLTVDGREFHEGDRVSIDGTTGEVFAGQLDTEIPDLDDEWLSQLMSWADEVRRLGVRANADYPVDAQTARDNGAEGIGLCRTEHMFFEPERLPIVQRMILAETEATRSEAVWELLPFQRKDFAGLFEVMTGLPVIIRLLDPPLHEFLPSHDELVRTSADLHLRLVGTTDLTEAERIVTELQEAAATLERVETLRESNPMLGLRGCRLGIRIPELTRMQTRAIIEAAIQVTRAGGDVHPKIMIPLACHANEIEVQRRVIDDEATTVMAGAGIEVAYEVGTMIEIPRAALTAEEIAWHADFFSFGTNDLTQTTLGMSRDDAEPSFLVHYVADEILPDNPFGTLDRSGVGRLMGIAVEDARRIEPEMEIGICGEHGGDPRSIALCHELGFDYVSCSPYRVPIARLAAAHATLASP